MGVQTLTGSGTDPSEKPNPMNRILSVTVSLLASSCRLTVIRPSKIKKIFLGRISFAPEEKQNQRSTAIPISTIRPQPWLCSSRIRNKATRSVLRIECGISALSLLVRFANKGKGRKRLFSYMCRVVQKTFSSTCNGG